MSEMQNESLLPRYSFNARLVAGLTPIDEQGLRDYFIDRPAGMKGYVLNFTLRGEGVVLAAVRSGGKPQGVQRGNHAPVYTSPHALFRFSTE